MSEWSQDTAGQPWHQVVDAHRNAQYTACRQMLVNARGHSETKPLTNLCDVCVELVREPSR